MSSATTFHIATAEHIVSELARERARHQRDAPTPEAMAYREWVQRRRDLDAEFMLAQSDLQRLIDARPKAALQENTTNG